MRHSVLAAPKPRSTPSATPAPAARSAGRDRKPDSAVKAPRPKPVGSTSTEHPLLATLRLLPAEHLAPAQPPLPGTPPSEYHAALVAFLTANPAEPSRSLNAAWKALVTSRTTTARLATPPPNIPPSPRPAPKPPVIPAPPGTPRPAATSRTHWLLQRHASRKAVPAEPATPSVPQPEPPAPAVAPPPEIPTADTAPVVRKVFVSEHCRAIVSHEFIQRCLHRFKAGDWGDETDVEANRTVTGGRTIGRYAVPAEARPDSLQDAIRIVLVVVGDPDRVTALLDHEFDR